MRWKTKYIPGLLGLYTAGLCFVHADEVTEQNPEPSVSSRQIKMHEAPGVSSTPDKESDYSFEERGDDMRLRGRVFEEPVNFDPRLFNPQPAPSRKPERRKNWLTPKSNMDRIQGNEEDDSDTSESSREDDGESRGWLVDDVMSRQEERNLNDDQELKEDGSTAEDDDFNGYEEDIAEDREEENEDSIFNVFTPTSNYLDGNRPGDSEETENGFMPYAGNDSSPNGPEADVQRLYDQPIQWGGVLGNSEFMSEGQRSADFSRNDSFKPTAGAGAGSIDQLNQKISQTLSQPAYQNSEQSSQSSSDVGASLRETATPRTSAFSSTAYSSGGLSADRGSRRTTTSSGFSGWSPSGPQQPVQAFEPLSSSPGN